MMALDEPTVLLLLSQRHDGLGLLSHCGSGGLPLLDGLVMLCSVCRLRLLRLGFGGLFRAQPLLLLLLGQLPCLIGRFSFLGRKHLVPRPGLLTLWRLADRHHGDLLEAWEPRER